MEPTKGPNAGIWGRILDNPANLDQRAQDAITVALQNIRGMGSLRVTCRAGRDFVDANMTLLSYKLREPAAGGGDAEQQALQVAGWLSLLERCPRVTRLEVLVYPATGPTRRRGEEVASTLATRLLSCPCASRQRVSALELRVVAQGLAQQQPSVVLSPSITLVLPLAFPNLTRLELRGCWVMPASVSQRQMVFTGLAQLPRLKALSLSCYPGLEHIGLLAAGCPLLQELALGMADGALLEAPPLFTVAAAAAVASLPALCTLHVHNMHPRNASLPILLEHVLTPGRLGKLKVWEQPRHRLAVTTWCCLTRLLAAERAASSGQRSGPLLWQLDWSPRVIGGLCELAVVGRCVASAGGAVQNLDVQSIVIAMNGDGNALVATSADASSLQSMISGCTHKRFSKMVVCIAGDDAGAAQALAQPGAVVAALNQVASLLMPPIFIGFDCNAPSARAANLLAFCRGMDGPVKEALRALVLPSLQDTSPLIVLEVLEALPTLELICRTGLSTAGHGWELVARLAAAPERLRRQRINILNESWGALADVSMELNRCLQGAGVVARFTYPARASLFAPW